MQQVGIIAGSGQLPFVAAREARAQGLRVVAAAIRQEASPGADLLTLLLDRQRDGSIADDVARLGSGLLGGLVGGRKP